MKAKIRNTEIYYDIAGSQLRYENNKLIEKPVLFLVHGGPGGNHLRFKKHSLALQEYAQLVFIDNRGSGFSKRGKKSEYTMENNIEDLEALRLYLGLEKICMLGVSYGGMVAQGYAIKYGKHLEKLILVATTPSYRFIEESKKYLATVGTKTQIEICDKLLWPGKFRTNKDVSDYAATMESLYSHARKQPKIPVKDANMIFEPDVINAGFGGFLKTFNFIPQLKKIKCPTLILSGKDDWICRPNQAREMAKHIPNSKLITFERCGHAIPNDAAEKYLKVVGKFLL